MDEIPPGWLAYAMARNFFATLVAIQIHVLLHELSHALAARIVGFRVTQVRVGPLELVGGLRWANRAWDPRVFLSGATQSIPLGGRNVSGRMALVTAGGPIGTLVASAAGFGLFLLIQEATTLRVLVFFVIAGPLIFVANIIPIKRTALGLPNDGWNLFAYLFRPRAWAGRVRLLERVADMAAGTRPATWMSLERWKEELAPVGDDDGWTVLEALLVGADRGERAVVEDVLLEGRARESAMSRPIRLDWRVQEAAWRALVAGTAEQARQALPTRTLPGFEGYDFLAQACVELKNDNEATAQLLAARWTAFIRKQPSPVQTLGGNQWIVETLARRLSEGKGRAALEALMSEPYFLPASTDPAPSANVG